MNTHTLSVATLTLATSLALLHPAHADVLSSPTSARSAQTASTSSTNFNPAISLILDGRYVATNLDELELPGFQAGGAEPPADGFGLGESELSISANVDDKIFGWFTLAIEEEDGETKTEIEEAYIESLGLGSGLTLRGGRFYSHLGYENPVHDHALDFTDRALVYSAMFGGNLLGDGVQARWIAPTDFFLELGVELTDGEDFPGSANDNSIGSTIMFARTGGDFGVSHAWRLGTSYFSADFDDRPNAEQADPNIAFSIADGSSDIFGIDFVYKWAPNGNPTQRNFKLAAEYFLRNEDGIATLNDGGNTATANYDGDQYGFYIQALYQWRPQWRAGLRYDQISSDNRLTGFDGGATTQTFAGFADESGLISNDDPTRWTASVDFSPSEFSRFRLQYSQFDSGQVNEDTLILQYIVSLGAHPAHSF